MNLEKNFWVGVKFYVVNIEMAQSVQRILPKHVIATEIGSKTAGLARPLEATAESTFEFFND